MSDNLFDELRILLIEVQAQVVSVSAEIKKQDEKLRQICAALCIDVEGDEGNDKTV